MEKRSRVARSRAATSSAAAPSTLSPVDFAAMVFLVCLVVFVVVARIATAPATASVVDPSEPELTEVELQALIRQATLRTSVRSCGVLTRGSGVIIEGRLITNAHVVGGAAEVKVDQPIAPVIVPVVATNSGVDLAAAEQPAGVGIALSSDASVAGDAIVGTEVVLAGHVDGRSLQIRTGSVALRASGAAYGIDSDVLLIDARTSGGDSGGPVLDRHGRLVGVLSGYDLVTERTIAIPADVIRSFLNVGASSTQDSTAGCPGE